MDSNDEFLKSIKDLLKRWDDEESAEDKAWRTIKRYIQSGASEEISDEALNAIFGHECKIYDFPSKT